MIEGYKIEIRADPLTLYIEGAMKPDSTVSAEGVSNGGGLIESAKSCLVVVNSGTYKNTETGDVGSLDPGLYLISSDGFHIVKSE